MARIAIVEDERPLRQDLVEYLGSCGHTAFGCEDAKELDALLAVQPVDIVVLDLNLPGEDGFSVATKLRRNSAVGIIILSARSMNMDRVVGLEVGADVYLVKPVDLREVEAQVRALLRRMPSAQSSPTCEAQFVLEAAVGRVECWAFDPMTWTVTSPLGRRMKLTASERTFLSRLAERPGEAVTRDAIMIALGKKRWDLGDRSIDALVHRLQSKAEEVLGERLPLSAVHGLGYAFSAPLATQ